MSRGWNRSSRTTNVSFSSVGNGLKSAPERTAMADEAQERRAPPITHVIFDMDGLLLDTEKYYTISQEKILSSYGKTFDWSLKAKMMGKRALEAGQILVKESGLEGILSAEEFIKQRELILYDLFPNSDLMPGVEQLVMHLHECKIPMAIATSSHKRHFELKTMKHQEMISHMHHVVVGDDPAVKHGKPAPDIFLVAAQRFEDPNLKSDQILVFEDAPTGVEAALTAGIAAKLTQIKKIAVWRQGDTSTCSMLSSVQIGSMCFNTFVFGEVNYSILKERTCICFAKYHNTDNRL